MKIAVINTGGTYNKRYDMIKGQLISPKDHKALEEIIECCHNIEFNIKDVVSKDSLEMNDEDRELIIQTIQRSPEDKIIIVHGTDTIDVTATLLDERIKDKTIVLTGTMVPMSIEKVEATHNFSLALGFLSADVKQGVYVAMHGIVAPHEKLLKNREVGKFLLQ